MTYHHHFSSTKRSSITIIPNQTTQVPILSHGLMCIPHLCSAWCIRLCHQWRRRNAIISTTSYTRLQYIPKAMDGWFIVETLSCFLVGEKAGLEEVEGWCCCWCGWLWLLWHFWFVSRIFWRKKDTVTRRRRMMNNEGRQWSCCLPTMLSSVKVMNEAAQVRSGYRGRCIMSNDSWRKWAVLKSGTQIRYHYLTT